MFTEWTFIALLLPAEKKALQCFWPLPSFCCKALTEVMTKTHSYSTVESGSLNAYMESFKITLQLSLDKKSPNFKVQHNMRKLRVSVICPCTDCLCNHTPILSYCMCLITTVCPDGGSEEWAPYTHDIIHFHTASLSYCSFSLIQLIIQLSVLKKL